MPLATSCKKFTRPTHRYPTAARERPPLNGCCVPHTSALLGLKSASPLTPLFKICRELHQLSWDRSFWVTCLETAHITIPLPCPTHEDLSIHDLAGLRALAVQTLRREQNWSLAEPRICGEVKSISCEAPHDLVIQVPGTQLVVGHSEELRALTCWDFASGANLSSIYVGHFLCEVSPMRAAKGRVTLAFLISEDTAEHLEYLNPPISQTGLLITKLPGPPR